MTEANKKYWGNNTTGIKKIKPELSDHPSSSEKVDYLKSYFDYVLGEMNSEVKDELLDHFIINLESSIEKGSKDNFVLAFGRYNHTFGGAKRIRKIARSYSVAYDKNLSKYSRSQFFTWSKPRAIWILAPLLISLYTFYQYYNKTMSIVLICISFIVLIPLIVASYKNEKRKKDLNVRDRKIDKYLGMPKELLTSVMYGMCLISSLVTIPILEPQGLTIYSISLFSITYVCVVVFYYHMTESAVNMEPLIEQLKVELSKPDQTIAHAG